MSLYWKTSMASRRLMGFKRLLSRLLYVIRSVHSAHLINRHEHDSQNVDPSNPIDAGTNFNNLRGVALALCLAKTDRVPCCGEEASIVCSVAHRKARDGSPMRALRRWSRTTCSTPIFASPLCHGDSSARADGS